MTDRVTVENTVIKWYWSSLGRDDGTARMTRARLKRCELPAEALAIEATHELNKMLRAIGKKPSSDQLALLVVTFARLQLAKDGQGEKIAVLFGRKSIKDGPRRLSDLRFQALIRIREHRDLITPLRRALGVLGADFACNGFALARDLYWWSDDVRNRWCYQYFAAEIAANNKYREES